MMVSKSTSPPKYRERSTKWVACSTIGPQSIDLFHQANFRLASYATISSVFYSDPPITYRAEVIITVRLFSWMICFIFCTAAE